MLSLEERARRFATRAHAAQDQRRKYTNDPYIIHPAAVVEQVRLVLPEDEPALAAAWLHDTVEDTDTTLADIESHFGPEVARLVEMLTNPPTPEEMNRAQRKRLHFQHTAHACSRAQTIKLADIIDNTRELLHFDPDFARVYLLEKRLQLDSMTQGDARLRQQALQVVEQGITQLMRPPYNVPAAWFDKRAIHYLTPQA